MPRLHFVNRYDNCHHAQRCILFIVMLNANMLNVIALNVIMRVSWRLFDPTTSDGEKSLITLTSG
jgi:hypothetical protein